MQGECNNSSLHPTMMTVLSRLLKTPNRNSTGRPSRPSPRRTSSAPSSYQSPPETNPPKEPEQTPYLREASHLSPIESEDPDLRELNNSLTALAAIFPDVQVE